MGTIGEKFRRHPIKMLLISMFAPLLIGAAIKLAEAPETNLLNETTPPNTIGGSYRPSLLPDNTTVQSYQLFTGEIASVTESNGEIIHAIINPDNGVRKVLERTEFNELLEDRGVANDVPEETILNQGEITQEGKNFFSLYGFDPESCSTQYGDISSGTLFKVTDEISGSGTWEFFLPNGSREMSGQGTSEKWENMTMRLTIDPNSELCIEG